MSEPFDLERHRAEQERARALGLGYAMLRDIILQAHSDAADGISMGRAVELVREMALRAVDKAVAEKRAEVARLQAALEEASAKVEDLQMQRDEHIIDLQHAREEAVAEERAAVVAWLREYEGHSSLASLFASMADTIERGEHRREELADAIESGTYPKETP